MDRDNKKRSKLRQALMGVAVLALLLAISSYYYNQITALRAEESSARLDASAERQEAVCPHENLTELLSDEPFPAENQYCLACHQGIEPTRPMKSPMMQQILALGRELGDPNGCVVCHGGTPSEQVNKNIAHSGAPKGSALNTFTPVPAALQINDKTCALCHSDHVYSAHLSMMNTDAGKMKTIAWSFGIGTENHDHIYSDHDVTDTDGNVPRFGTPTYKEYMIAMAEAFSGQFRSELKQVPHVTAEDIKSQPELAAFTYLRNCNSCHLSNKGQEGRGFYRGMGCAACHSIYSNEGFYEGEDPSIVRDQPGHVLVHSMQGTRKSSFQLNGHTLSGVQNSTCASCHAAGRRIGHAYQGLMALDISSNRGPFDENGEPQPTSSAYVFKYIRDDVHHRLDKDGVQVQGLLCQDCHTTIGMHGAGNIEATTLAAVEIECADCHGTPTHYPWELPIGYGDEYNKSLDMSQGRGVAEEPKDVTKQFGITYPKQDGYLLTARGNPFGNVVRKGNRVVVHSDTGHDFEVKTLKEIYEGKEWKNNDKAYVAMVQVEKHMESLECYACHATWAPQYYGYKYVIDYRKKSIDWLNSPQEVYEDGTTADYRRNYIMQDGAPTLGDYSHIRWENPPLGINGEGRVTPLTGVIQTVSTVIDADGNTVVWNNVAQAEAGYNAIEMAPLQPHTVSLQARECSDCHGDLVAAGYGLDGGVYDANPDIPKYGDVKSTKGENVSNFTQAQISAIAKLHGDFTQILGLDGTQLMTVDSHWPTSMPLTERQREALGRNSTCYACHIDIPDGTIPNKMLTAVAKIANLSFRSEEAHSKLLRENNLMIAWIKALGVVALVALIPIIILLIIYRRRVVTFFNRLRRGYILAGEERVGEEDGRSSDIDV